MRCGFHIDPRYLEHVTPQGHPERPERIDALLADGGLALQCGAVSVDSQRSATDSELRRVHTRAHVGRIDATAGKPHDMLDPDTHTGPDSARIARLAAGALLDLVDQVSDGRLDRAFAAIRPPGHHAERNGAMGFCLFNNVAVVASHLLEQRGLTRVLVVDPDVHHGNGTQNIFYEDPRVLVVSLHQSPFYPGSGAVDETGKGDGLGFTINVPLPAGCDDGDYLSAFERIVIPASRHFNPEFVLVSAGFDAHDGDPLGGMRVSDAGFGAMASMLCSVADECAAGRMVAALEGGYSLSALRSGVAAVVTQMSGSAPAPRVEARAVEGATAIAAAAAVSGKVWPVEA